MPHSISIEATALGLNQFQQKFGTQMHQKLKQGLELESELPFVEAEYAYTGQDIEVADVLQPYQAQFTPNNSETFDGITNYLRPLKVDVQYTAEQLEKFFAKWKPNWFTPGAEDIQRGYASYIINNHLLPQVTEELNLASWAGQYVAPVAGTPGTVLQSVDGFKKFIAAQITAGRLTVLPTGALVASTMVAQVRDFCSQVPEPYRYLKGMLFMSKTNAQAYADDYLDKYPRRDAAVSNADSLYLNVDNYNKTIKGITAMEGSDRIICVFGNRPSMIVGTRMGYPRYFSFRFQPFDRTIKCMAEIYRFYGAETLLHAFVNDQV
jgi:hypothetical protein